MSLFGQHYCRNSSLSIHTPLEQFVVVLGSLLADDYPQLAFLLQPANEQRAHSQRDESASDEEEAKTESSIVLIVAQEMSRERDFHGEWRQRAEQLCEQLCGASGVRFGAAAEFDFSSLEVGLSTFTIEDGWRRACLPCKDRRGRIYRCFSTHLHMLEAATSEQSFEGLLTHWSEDSLHRFDVKHALGGDCSVWKDLVEQHSQPPLGFGCNEEGVWMADRPIWDVATKRSFERAASLAAIDNGGGGVCTLPTFCATDDLDESDFCAFLKHCIDVAARD